MDHFIFDGGGGGGGGRLGRIGQFYLAKIFFVRLWVQFPPWSEFFSALEWAISIGRANVHMGRK